MNSFPSPEYEELDPARSRSESAPQGAEQKEQGQGAVSFERDPIQLLKDDKAEVYCNLVESLIKGGKPNSFFPSGKGIENLIYLLRPSTNRGLTNEVQVNLRVGLPSEPNIGRVIADKDICSKFLRSNDVEAIYSRQDEATKRLINRINYYKDVEKRELPQRFSLELKLKRTNNQDQTADFIALFERYDPGEGLFTRYSIDLRHQHQRWSKPKVELQGDDLRYTEEFRNVISRYSSDEAEFAFILLSDVPGITVLEISRGRIGPLWMNGIPAPAPITELLEKYPGNAILNFPYEKVFVPEVEGKTDDNRDPFMRLYRDSLDKEERSIANARATKLGYIVMKDRKFCCTRPILNPLKELLTRLGKPCVLYPPR